VVVVFSFVGLLLDAFFSQFDEMENLIDCRLCMFTLLDQFIFFSEGHGGKKPVAAVFLSRVCC